MSTATAPLLGYDADVLYRAVASRDRRFDGRFVLGVTSTGIYCRPSCPARTPKAANVRYFALPAAAVAAGFRACRRCRPERVSARPHIADESGVVERALALIGQGVVDDSGVSGLASRLAVSERQLHRLLVTTVGTGAIGLAQARRAQTARTLLEQTPLPVTDIAYASGFGSLRQFNDVMRAEYGMSPSGLRQNPSTPDRPAGDGSLVLRMPVTGPWDGDRLLAFLGGRAISGVEAYDGGRYTRSLATSHGDVRIAIEAGAGVVHVELTALDFAAVGAAVIAVRRLCDLACDIEAVESLMGAVSPFAALVSQRAGLRVPGAVSGWEVLVRAIVGQQVSVVGARTLLRRIVERCDVKVHRAAGEIAYLFPSASALLATDLTGVGLTGQRVLALTAAAEAVAAGRLLLTPGDDPQQARQRLRALPGVGPWTTEYVAMRALADPDAWPSTDLVLARKAADLDTDKLRPWRAYAAIHLWTQHSEETA